MLLLGLMMGRVMAEEAGAVSVVRAAVNRVLVKKDGRSVAIYAVEPTGPGSAVEHLLLTHHRRDVLANAAFAGRAGVKVVVPEKERASFENPGAFWERFAKARFHDYEQQSTKVPTQPLPFVRSVKEGDTLELGGMTFQVLETPGYTRGSVSYVTSVAGKRIAFTGDLIYGEGQLLDLYSFQDAIPEASIRGYHGYGSRLAALVTSLERLAALSLHRIIPARGPVIENPGEAIATLLRRVRALYHNYLSSNALHWYFKEERMRTCGERVLGKGAEVTLMPYALHQKAPEWVLEQATSRLLVSDSGAGFLIDCGYQQVIDAIKRWIKMGLIQRVEGIFVTHYHDDHTDQVQAAAKEFQCPVYATEEYADILARPSAYQMPAMTSQPIEPIQVQKSGTTLRWHEFDLTFHFYPGQAYYHGALLARRGQERPIFFIGDSFAPSGLDDYCVLNRNLLHEDSGYPLCFKKLRQLPKDTWLVNEHIPYVFAFTESELRYLETRYAARTELCRQLFPWDDPNYGVDEQWAVFYPYGSVVAAGAEIHLELRLTNHSPKERTFRVKPHLPDGLVLVRADEVVTLPSRASGRAHMVVRVGAAKPGVHVLTADVDSEGMTFERWCEAMITVRP